MSRLGWIATAVIAAIVALFLVARFWYSGTAPVSLPAAQCDASLWPHVYERERLQVIEPCTAVEGRVVTTFRNADGDLHIGLDPDDKHLMNLMNATHGRRTLIVEIVCEHDATHSNAKAACGSYRSTATVPKAGDRIRVTGAYVTERDNGWNEIHPVTRIDLLR